MSFFSQMFRSKAKKSSIPSEVASSDRKIPLLSTTMFLVSSRRDPLTSSNNLSPLAEVEATLHHSHIYKDIENTRNPECTICGDQFNNDSAKFIVLNCGHGYCKECLGHYVDSKIEDGTVIDIPCPESVNTSRSESKGCGSCISPINLQEILNKDKYDLLDHRRFQLAMAIDSDIYACATPDCPYAVCWVQGEGAIPVMNCSQCHKTRCLACKISPYHYGKTCDGIAIDDGKRASETTSRSKWLCFCPWFSKKPIEQQDPVESEAQIKAEENEKKFMDYLSKNEIQKCKRCSNAVLKDRGCHKVKCRCGYRFCWVCGSENAQCKCTPASHGFIDNVTGHGDFSNLRSKVSPT